MSDSAASPEGTGPAASEKSARHTISPGDTASTTTTTTTTASPPADSSAGNARSSAAPKKPRSCVTCRSRKVRCDKNSPCSNCRRAQIPCVFPSADKPPRWARRLERVAQSAQAAQTADDPHVGQVMDRLRSLEGLVRELSGQLEQAHAAAAAAKSGAGEGLTGSSQTYDADHQLGSSSSANVSDMRGDFGRLVLGDANQTRFLSTGFWSRVNDELNGLKMDTAGLAGGEYDSSDDDDLPASGAPLTKELDRTASQRNAFFFRHNLTSPSPDLREFHPLPSQIPFLINVFHDNINIMAHVVHTPSVVKMIRELPNSDLSALSPANEALMFAIYYSAINSMEDDDIKTNFASSKSDLNLKYRLGFEQALAKADFLGVPNFIIVQALCIYLLLVRRHDNPTYTWMMTGLLIKMSQALGLHRDGSTFPHLTPFEVETRRRAWWTVCILDLRSSEDQNMELSIGEGSFDTRLPLSINVADLDPDMRETPQEREGLTDMSLSLVSCGLCDVMRQMFFFMHRKDGKSGVEDQNRLLGEINESLERGYLQHPNPSKTSAYWMMVVLTRLVISKMTLVIYLPEIFSSSKENFSNETRDKLLVAAIEVAEYNHVLSAEKAHRQWRWLIQTCTHWHAIIYLLLASAQRPWSPHLERAWVALHSIWLIPTQGRTDKNLWIWNPLRKLMVRTRRHREAELERLRGDPLAVQRLEAADRHNPQPGSPGPFPGEDNAECFRQRWLHLVTVQPGFRTIADKEGQYQEDWSGSSNAARSTEGTVSSLGSGPNPDSNGTGYQLGFGNTFSQSNSTRGSDILHPSPLAGLNGQAASELDIGFFSGDQPADTSAPSVWPSMQYVDHDFSAWQWASGDVSTGAFAGVGSEAVDMNMDIDGGMDWNNWLQSANNVDLLNEPLASSGPWF